MTVIIPHPTEELIFAKLQKELISELFEDGRIMIAENPLWIPLNPVIECEQGERIEITGASDNCDLDTENGGFDTTLRVTQPPVVGELEICENSVFIPLTIATVSGQLNSKLTLVRLHKGCNFDKFDREKLVKIKQPVKQKLSRTKQALISTSQYFTCKRIVSDRFQLLLDSKIRSQVIGICYRNINSIKCRSPYTIPVICTPILLQKTHYQLMTLFQHFPHVLSVYMSQ
jgi:hypothetical protein